MNPHLIAAIVIGLVAMGFGIAALACAVVALVQVRELAGL